jgi:hypothetical protein
MKKLQRLEEMPKSLTPPPQAGLSVLNSDVRKDFNPFNQTSRKDEDN